jgi:hypothetical protein
MEQTRIDEIKARANGAAVHEYDGITDLIYGRDVKALLTEVERLTAENAKLQEKQTAKAAIVHYEGSPDWKFRINECPICKGKIHSGDIYCNHCGQKILWEE